MVAKNILITQSLEKWEKYVMEKKWIFPGSCGLEPPKRICQILKKEVREDKIMECMNCGQKASFNREVYYVGTANHKLLKLSERCKNPENKFD